MMIIWRQHTIQTRIKINLRPYPRMGIQRAPWTLSPVKQPRMRENYIEQPLRISENCPKDRQDEKHLFNKG